VNDVLSPEVLNGRSHSHPMNAGYDEWFFRVIAGIHPNEKAPGFKNILFRPYFTSTLKHAGATYESPYGTIASNWKWEGDTFAWDVEIPDNSSGVLFIPEYDQHKTVRINGKTIDALDLSVDQQYPDFWVYNTINNGKFRVEVE
jgi:alpha-L-rhamnosidase